LIGNPNASPINVRFCDFPNENRDLKGCSVGWNSGVLGIIDLMEPTVKSGSGEAKMLCHFSSGYAKGFDMLEDKQSLSKRVSRFLLSLLNPLLEDRHLHFELADLVSEKEDFVVFGIGVHGRKAS